MIAMPTEYAQLGTLVVGGDREQIGFLQPHWQVLPGSDTHQLCDLINRTLRNPSYNIELYRAFQFAITNYEVMSSSIPLWVTLLPEGAWRILMKTRSDSLLEIGIIDTVVTTTNNSLREKSSKELILISRGILEEKIEALEIGEELVIGRSTDLEGLSFCRSLSREHLEVKRLTNNDFVVVDLKSTNGTYVLCNGFSWERFKGKNTLVGGTTIRLGHKDDGLVLQLPKTQSPFLYPRAKITSSIGQLEIGETLNIGKSSSYLNLKHILGIDDNHLEIIKESSLEYTVNLISNSGRTFLRENDEEWLRLVRGGSFKAGVAFKLGDIRNGIDFYLPLPITNKILATPTENKLSLGRSNESLALIDYPSISREHAEIYPLPKGSYLLTDLKSTNGTFISTDSIDQWQRIVGTTRVIAGTHVRLGTGTGSVVFTLGFQEH
jgi:pSer/pThr/pTyr-binding forkhead associated (FHA) protein